MKKTAQVGASVLATMTRAEAHEVNGVVRCVLCGHREDFHSDNADPQNRALRVKTCDSAGCPNVECGRSLPSA